MNIGLFVYCIIVFFYCAIISELYSRLYSSYKRKDYNASFASEKSFASYSSLLVGFMSLFSVILSMFIQ